MSYDQPKQRPVPLPIVLNTLEPDWTVRRWAERRLLACLMNFQESLAWMKERMGVEELPK